MGIDPEGKYIPLEQLVYDIACRKNTTTIGFFDCCRVTDPETSLDGKSKSMMNHEGRFVIFYPTRIGMQAYTGPNSSLATSSLLKHFSNISGKIDVYEHIKST